MKNGTYVVNEERTLWQWYCELPLICRKIVVRDLFGRLICNDFGSLDSNDFKWLDDSLIYSFAISSGRVRLRDCTVYLKDEYFGAPVD